MLRFGLLCSILILSLLGCSSENTNPLIAGSVSGNSTIVDLFENGNSYGTTGIFAGFDLAINFENATAELTPRRDVFIGESYIVSGISYFTIAPCPNCLEIAGISLNPDGNIVLTFKISHPFDKGNTGAPPTAANRLDLDIFDPALIVRPKDTLPDLFTLTDSTVYTDICENADGYTCELSGMTGDDSAMPYFLIVDDNLSGTSTYNRFEMGTENALFDTVFNASAGTIRFELYLTMGYGFSAVKANRLIPKYYNPEFNRKAAWKVAVTPPVAGSTWIDDDDATTHEIVVEVYDWQVGATVYATPDDFANAPSDNIYAASEPSLVSVEIPGMNSTLQSVADDDGSGTGMPDSPLVYKINIANENLLSEGEYTGLVKVTDERPVLSAALLRDYLINSPDGVALENYSMPEYATYQAFTAIVESGSALQSVENVSIKINRITATLPYIGYPFDPAAPWTLNWDAASGAVEYAIYYDLDPTDGLENNFVFVDVTTETHFDVPPSHMDTNGTHYAAGLTYIVRARSEIGNPLSESADSEPAFITANGFETVPDHVGDYPMTTIHNVEGWQGNAEGSSEYNIMFVSGPAPSHYRACHGDFNASDDSFLGHPTSSSNWCGMTKETPTVRDATIRRLEASAFCYRFTSPDWGVIFGTSSSRPERNFTNTTDITWAEADDSPGYKGYNTDSSDIRTTYSGVPSSGNVAWYFPFEWDDPPSSGILNPDSVAVLAANVNNFSDPYVAIQEAILSYISTNYTHFDDMAIVIY